MVKTRWVRNAAIFGTAVTLSLATVGIPANEGSAASFCQETEMAGLSLSLDKFYSVNYANADSLNSVGATTAPQTAESASSTAAPQTSAAPTAEPAEETEEKTEEKRKEETVAKQFRDLGISKVTDYVNIRKRPTGACWKVWYSICICQ